MKKTLLTFGVLSAVVCGTLAYSSMEPGFLSNFGVSGKTAKEIGKTSDAKTHKATGVLDRGVKINSESLALAMSRCEDADKSNKRVVMRENGSNVEQVVVDLWNNASMVLPFNENSVFDRESNTISFPGSAEQTNYIFAGTNAEGTSYEWYAEDGQTYTFRGHLTADGQASVHACVLYLNGGQLYIANSSLVILNEDNSYSSDFTVDASGTAQGQALSVAFLVSDSSSDTTIMSTDNEFYYAYTTITSQKWTEETDLPGLGLSADNAEYAYTIVCEDGITTIGVIFDGSYIAYITGINTTAEEVTLPQNSTIDGNVVPLSYFGNYCDMDWSGCPSLKRINMPYVQHISTTFVNSSLTDLYIGSVEDFYFGTPGSTTTYLHIPYGEYRYNYSGLGFARVLVGDELPSYPETKVSDWVIAGEEEGDYFGIKYYNNSYYIMEIFTSKESVRLPYFTPAAGGNYYVRTFGYDSYYGSGRLCINAANLKSVIVPPTFTGVNVDWSENPIRELHMEGDVPSTYWSLPSGMTVYVLDQTCYGNYENNSNWNSASIQPEGWEFEWMTVNVGRKGEFAQTYIEMTDANWGLGTYVKITGKLNTTDLNNIKNLTNLRKLDLSEAEFDVLPASFMQDMNSLSEVTLPESVQTIPNSAFNSCTKLTKVTSPGVKTVGERAFSGCNNLKEFDLSAVNVINSRAFYNCNNFNPAEFSSELYVLGQYAFYNTAITEAVIPETLRYIDNSVFFNCTSLTKVELPSTMLTIYPSAFSECNNLTEINLPEGITSIGNAAFSGCSSLSEITIPSTLLELGYNVFSSCTSLNSVKCKAVVPPLAGGTFVSGMDLSHCTLYVAPFAIDAYRDAQYWSEFYIMKPLNEPVKNIYVQRPMSFDLLSEDNAVLQDNPNMTLTYSNSSYGTTVGQLSATGDGTLSAGIFWIDNYFRRRTNNSSECRPTLVNNAENMRADSVLCSINLEKNYWHFISFQYDVLMEDVFGYNNTDFVIRRYNSVNRATGDGTVSSWENVPADGVLEAGKGYIIQAANNTTDANGYTNAAIVCFPSRNTVTKNRLFTSNNVIVPLEEYAAEFAHNRSWNLVGNPYPCYYDMHYLLEDFYTPIVLWRGTSYQAYSPIDDDIILRPNEAFFVQRPLDAEQMVFGVEGRMHFDEARNAGYDTTPGISAPALTQERGSRSVFNFNVSGNGSDDRARIVMNEEARMDYEINRDASKFFAESSQGVEIFVNSDVRYDICERPLSDGTATLGARFAATGEYTISLDGRNIAGWTVILTDTATGVTTDLSESAYTFDAEAGTAADRFMLTFIAPGTSVDGIEAAGENADVQVFDASGINVFRGDFNEFKAGAQAGVYIVVSNGKATKIMIK